MAELNAHNPGVYPGGVSAADGHGAEGGHTHQYHLVNPSPWPLLGAFSAGLMAVGGVMYMHGSGWLLAALGFLCVLTVMAGWWRDVVRESVHEKAHTPSSSWACATACRCSSPPR